jgi:hypothetical protein
MTLLMAMGAFNAGTASAPRGSMGCSAQLSPRSQGLIGPPGTVVMHVSSIVASHGDQKISSITKGGSQLKRVNEERVGEPSMTSWPLA